MKKTIILKEMILNYINEYEGIKAPGTTKSEYGLLKSLLKCFNHLNIKTIIDLEYESYKLIINYYKNYTKQKNASINKNTSFLKTVLRHNDLIQHPILLTKPLKNDVMHVKPFLQDELIDIIRYFNAIDTSANSHVYRGVINMLYATGCRVGELLDIQIRNVNLKYRMILLTKTKTMKPRYVYYNSHQDEIVKELLDNNLQDKWLFWNNLKNRRLSKEDIKNYNRKISRKLDININTRRFRKTMATDLARVTSGDLKMIQTILGHSDIKMTQVYVEYTEEQAKELYDEKSYDLPIYNIKKE